MTPPVWLFDWMLVTSKVKESPWEPVTTRHTRPSVPGPGSVQLWTWNDLHIFKSILRVEIVCCRSFTCWNQGDDLHSWMKINAGPCTFLWEAVREGQTNGVSAQFPMIAVLCFGFTWIWSIPLDSFETFGLPLRHSKYSGLRKALPPRVSVWLLWDLLARICGKASDSFV